MYMFKCIGINFELIILMYLCVDCILSMFFFFVEFIFVVFDKKINFCIFEEFFFMYFIYYENLN